MCCCSVLKTCVAVECQRGGCCSVQYGLCRASKLGQWFVKLCSPRKQCQVFTRRSDICPCLPICVVAVPARWMLLGAVWPLLCEQFGPVDSQTVFSLENNARSSHDDLIFANACPDVLLQCLENLRGSGVPARWMLLRAIWSLPCEQVGPVVRQTVFLSRTMPGLHTTI